MIEAQDHKSNVAESGHFERMLSEIEDYAIIFLNREGKITQWNKGAEKIKGYAAEEVLGKHFELFYTPEDRAMELPKMFLKMALENGKSLHEGWRVRKDGTLFWGSILLVALHDEKGEVMGFAKVTRDLTERKHAEIMLEKKNHDLERINQDLSSFAYIASHDLQEPLRKIQTFISRIAEIEKDNLSEKSKDYFSRVENAGQRMQTLIDDLLTYSRANADDSKMVEVDLNVVLSESIKELSQVIEDKKAIIEKDTLPLIKGIAFQLQQVFTNLISNALKFSKSDVPPHITIRAYEIRKERMKTGLQEPKSVEIIFQDNGIGFEPEYKDKIFELFQRLHGRSEYEGTGIGLSICKKIIENHHGHIHAESIPGEGATFHIMLPLS